MTIMKKKLYKVTPKGPKRYFCNFVQFECFVNKRTEIMKNVSKNIDDKWQSEIIGDNVDEQYQGECMQVDVRQVLRTMLKDPCLIVMWKYIN